MYSYTCFENKKYVFVSNSREKKALHSIRFRYILYTNIDHFDIFNAQTDLCLKFTGFTIKLPKPNIASVLLQPI